MSRIVDRYGGFIIDLDGVVYLLHEEIPGSIKTLRYLQDHSIPFVFLTNNSMASPESYSQKLESFGISVSPQQIVTSPQALRRYIERDYNLEGKSAFVIGEEGLKTEMKKSGLDFVNGEKARETNFVIVGLDRNFDFKKLCDAAVAIRNGATFLATNGDVTYPTPQGLLPGAGAIVAAISAASGSEPYVAGKPNPIMIDLALERMGVSGREALMIGDRLETDIEAGVRAGIDTMLVLSGVSSEKDIEEMGIKPTYTESRLEDLLKG